MGVAQLLESITLELELRSIDLNSVIASVIAGLPAADRERIDYTCPQPITVMADEARLRFAIANLLNMNLGCALAGTCITVRAVHYERRAEISVLATACPCEQQWIAVEVLRKIAEAHGGSVVVAVVGSAMRLCLDLPATRRAPGRWPAHTSVLLVDDNVQQVTALAEVLRHYGLTIDWATTGRQALARIAARAPDVLIVDVQLPDMNGADVIRRAREHKPALPAALLTGYPKDHPMIANAIATTQSAYLAKPVNVEALLDVVATAEGSGPGPDPSDR